MSILYWQPATEQYPQKHFRPKPADKYLADLGIASETPSGRYTLAGRSLEEHWSSYLVEVFGTHVPPAIYISGGPMLMVQFDMISAVHIQLWQVRIFYASSPVYLEAQWHPQWGDDKRLSLTGLERRHSQGDVGMAHRGIDIFWKLTRPGPKNPIRNWQSKEHLESDLDDATRWYWDGFNEPLLTLSKAAGTLGVHPDTLSKAIKHYGVQFPRPRAELST